MQDHSAPGPTPSSMVPLVPLVQLDPPWSAISRVWLHKVDQAGSRWTRSGPGARAGPWCWVVDQGCSGPPWSTKKHFPNVVHSWTTLIQLGPLRVTTLWKLQTKVDQVGPGGPQAPWSWVLHQEHCDPVFTFC